MVSEAAAAAAQAGDEHQHSAGMRLSNSPPNFTHSLTLGSLASQADDRASDVISNRPNILILDDDDGEIQAESRQGHISFAPTEAANAPLRLTLFRQGTLTRRGQSMPAVSLPQTIADVLNPPSRGASPEPFRDTRTPDVQSTSEWPGSGLASTRKLPQRRFFKAGSPGQQLGAQLSGGSRARWSWICEGVVQDIGVAENLKQKLKIEVAEDSNYSAAHPLHTAIKKRQGELKGSLEINHQIKQALYDNWGKREKKHEVLEDLVDLELYIKANVQKFIEKTKAFIHGNKPDDNVSGGFGGNLAVKAGWVLSQRKGLWGSKTVRQHVQLCIDGSFLMRKTEQPYSPVINNLQIKDVLVEESPDCDCTINLVPIGSPVTTPAASQASVRRQRSMGHRTVSFTVNDPVSKAAWVQAFAVRQRIANQGTVDKMSVKALLSQLKGGRDRSALVNHLEACARPHAPSKPAPSCRCQEFWTSVKRE